MTRPNILCLVAEDCPTWLGAYGDPIANTPHLDRLAADGVTYETAMATSPVCAPSRFAILTGHHAESCPPAQHMTSWGPMPVGMTTYPEMMRKAGYYCVNNAKTHYNVDIVPEDLWDETSGSAHWMNRAKDQPFLAVFNTILTHESCIFEAREGAVTPAKVQLPGHLPDLPGLRQDMASYYNRIEEMDRFIADRLAELDAAQIADETIVIFHSDHASPLPRSKRFCYDDGVKVPLIIRVPEKWRDAFGHVPGTRRRDPVSLVDLMPSFASLAGVDAPDSCHGRSLFDGSSPRKYAASARDRMDEHYDMTRTLRSDRYRYIRNYAPHRIWGQHLSFCWIAKGFQEYEQAHLDGALDPVQQRFWDAKPAEELYDMQADPDSLHNLSNSPDHAEVLDKMRAALDAHMIQIGDKGFLPEGSEALNADTYDLAAALEIAATAIARDPRNAGHFVETLGHSDAVMRFWAASGLLMLATAGHPEPDQLADALTALDDLHAEIVLREALVHWGEVDAHIKWLVDLALSDKPNPLRIQAMDALSNLPMRPDLMQDAMSTLSEDPNEYVRGIAGVLTKILDQSYAPDRPTFRFDLFMKAPGHSGMGPQTFPGPEALTPAMCV